MDIRTGRTYASKDDALADGVPASDIAEISFDTLPSTVPIVRFATGPFKDRLYKRHPETGQLVRVDTA